MYDFQIDPASAWDAMLLRAHGCAIALLVVVGVVSLRRDRGSLAWAAAGVMGSALALGYLALRLPPNRIPTTWITLLSEGTGARDVMYTYGVGLHSGPALGAMVRGFADEGVLPLRVLVHINLCLAVINAGLFFGIARYLLKNAGLALGFTLGFVANLSFANAATSELPSQLLMLCFLAGVVALNAIANGPTYARWARAAGLALLLWASVAAALARVESVVLSVPAMVVGVLWTRRSPQEMEALGAQVYGWIRNQLSRPWWQLALLALASLLAQKYLFSRWTGRGAVSLDLAVAALPILLGQVLPLSMLLLFLLGTWRALRTPTAWAVIPLGIIWLFGMYHAASHGVMFELVRYTTALLACIALLAVLGWLELVRWTEQSEQPRQWRQKALVVLAMLTLVPAHRMRHGLAGLIRNDQQMDVQALVSAIEANPTCAVITKVVAPDQPPGHEEYGYLLIGAAGERTGAAAPASLGLQGALAKFKPAAPCVVFYQGLDCNRVGASCAEETRNAEQLMHTSYASRPYSDAKEYGVHSGTIELGSYRLR